MNRKIILVNVLLIFSGISAFSQSAIDTVWSGYIDLNGGRMEMLVTFRTEGGVLSAKMDIPEQKASGLELKNVKFDNPKVYFELESPIALAVFDGLYYLDSISGKFEQSVYTGTFSLFRGKQEVRKEEETEILPYNAEEVSFTNDGITFAGTLTFPKTEGRHPAVIMITGSGPQDRDEKIFGFKIFKVIADHLTRNGIAVLRYDDRGVGGTTGKSVSSATTADFAGDVLAAVQYLKTRNNINHSQIGLMGHSEGGIVAPIAASQSDDIAFIVLMAGTSVNGADIILEQTKLIMKAEKSSDEEIENYRNMLKTVFEAIKNQTPLEVVRLQIERDIVDNFDRIPKKERDKIKDKEKYASETATQTIKPFDSEWMKYFLNYDPSEALVKVKCPVLALFGENDLQVPPKQNEKPMTDALKKSPSKDVTIKTIPNTNHLFQTSATGSPSEYSSLPKEFAPGFLETVSEWILSRVTVVK